MTFRCWDKQNCRSSPFAMDIVNKKYAVVKFLSDSTFSEIPTAWLCEDDDNQLCWWPPRSSKLCNVDCSQRKSQFRNVETV